MWVFEGGILVKKGISTVAAVYPAVTGTVYTNGIEFPATQVASSNVNTLDDYEEGTYTPTVTASSGTFTTVSAVGKYTKVGNVVVAQIRATLTAIGTAVSTLRVTLPFTAAADNYSAGSGFESASTAFALGVFVDPATPTYMKIVKYDGNTIIANGYVVNATVTYFV